MRLTAALCLFPICLFSMPLCAQEGGTELGALEHQTLNLYNDGRIAEATTVALRAVKLAQDLYPANDFNVSTSLNNLAEMYKAQGQYDKAEPLLLRSLAIRMYRLGPNDAGTGGALNNLAELYRLQGVFFKAEPLYLSTLAIFEKERGFEHPDTVTVVNNLAVLYQSQGRLSKAEPLFVRALRTREKVQGKNSPATAGAANNLADLYNSEGRYALAEEYYTRAFDVYERAYGGIHPVAATILNNIAQLYSAQQQFAKAEPILKRAVATFEQLAVSNNPDFAKALNNLAEIYRHEGKFGLAEPLYQRAIFVYDKAVGSGHPDTVVFLNNLAELRSSQGRYSEAEPFYNRALAISQDRLGPDHPRTALALSNLALFYTRELQYAKAEPLLYRALEISRKTLGPDHPDNARLADDLATLLAAEGHADAAREILVADWPHRISWMDDALRFGRESFRRTWITGFEDQLSLLIALQTDSGALRSLGLETVLKTKNRISDELAVAMESRYRIDELKDLWEQQRHLEVTDPTSLGARRELKEREDKLIAEISTHGAEFSEMATTPSLADIRSRIKDSVLVEFVKFKEHSISPLSGVTYGPEDYGAYLVGETGGPSWVNLGPSGNIDKLVRRYREALGSPENSALTIKTARELEVLVFEPIRQAVPGARELYIAPDGLLQLISFSALPDSEGKPLLKRFVLHTLSTGRDLAYRDPGSAVRAPVIIGIERFGEKKPGRVEFADLQGAGTEADAVAKIIPSSQRIAADRLSREFLLEETNSPSILHLATHGFFSAGGVDAEAVPLLRSGIALYKANESDEGILTAKDVARLHLRGTQLVVLSACDSAVGDTTYADGVVGLQRSLRLAGAESEILTLWSVSDEKTRELMIAFYSNIFVKKLSKFEALRQAQIAMADQGIDPFYWAPFVLYGDPGPLR